MRAPTRRAALGLAAMALAGCGFRPLYGEAGPGRALAGAVRVAGAEGRLGYRFRQRLEERLGEPAAGAPYVLDVEIEVEETGLVISREDLVTRYDVRGVVLYALRDAATGEALDEGEARAVSAYSNLASPYASRVARRAAEERVAEGLADRVFTRLVAAVAEA